MSTPPTLPAHIRAVIEQLVERAIITEVEREKNSRQPDAEPNYRVITEAGPRKVAVIVTPDGRLEHQVELRLQPTDAPAAALARARAALADRAIEKVARITYQDRAPYYRFSHGKEHLRVTADGAVLAESGLK